MIIGLIRECDPTRVFVSIEDNVPSPVRDYPACEPLRKHAPYHLILIRLGQIPAHQDVIDDLLLLIKQQDASLSCVQVLHCEVQNALQHVVEVQVAIQFFRNAVEEGQLILHNRATILSGVGARHFQHQVS